MDTKVSNLMRKNVVQFDYEDTIIEIAREMTSKKIGSVVITKNSALHGIITKQDLLEKVVQKCINPCDVFAKDIATSPITTVSPMATIREALALMLEKGIHRLPVVDDVNGDLVGIITSSDILSAVQTRKISQTPKKGELEASRVD